MMTEVIDTSSALPKGWKWVVLGDIVNKKSKKVLPSEYPEAKFIGMDCIEPNTLRPSFLYKFSEFKSAGNFFKADQVLYGRMRPYLNKVYKAEFDGACSGEFIILECKENFNPDLLSYILHSKHFVRFANNKTNGDRPRITFEEIVDYPVALPPKSLHPIIVSKIEKLFSKLDKGIESLRMAQQQLKVYRQSVLKWAFEGRLTNEDVKEGELPEGWKNVKLKSISESIQYGYTESSSKYAIGPKFLRITDIQENRVEWNDVPYCKITKDNKKKYLLKDGDLVFARTGATVGKSFLIKGEIPEAVFASYLIRVRVNTEINDQFLSYFFLSPLYWNQITEGQVGIGQPNVNGTKLGQLDIVLAPLKDQSRIVEELENRLSIADKMEESINQGLQQTEVMRQSVLKRAFEGKLTN